MVISGRYFLARRTGACAGEDRSLMQMAARDREAQQLTIGARPSSKAGKGSLNICGAEPLPQLTLDVRQLNVICLLHQS